MARQKPTKGKKTEMLWDKNIEGIPLNTFIEDTKNTHKFIIYADSNSGKTRWWLKILQYYKKIGVKPEDVCFFVLYPDRRTGITKLAGMIPPEYLDSVTIFPVNKYEDLVSATGTANRLLKEHYKKTGKLGWMIVELVGEAWMMSQDYYTREAYGETLGDYFAEKQQLTQAIKEDSSAYRALEGWKDWTVIKYFHNYAWVEKIKRMPWNVLFTAEVKQVGNPDSMFAEAGYRPAGEKDNIHRVDEIIYLTRRGNKFSQKAFKLTGYTHVYPKIDISNKNGFEEHLKMLKKLEEAGYKESPMDEIEKEAGIEPPKPPKKETKKKEPKKEEEKKEEPKKEPEKTEKTEKKPEKEDKKPEEKPEPKKEEKSKKEKSKKEEKKAPKEKKKTEESSDSGLEW